MQLIAIEYPERRLNFFKEQLAAAHRRLDWSMKHNPDWNDHAEKGEVVSFYEWAVQMSELVHCRDCKDAGERVGDESVLCRSAGCLMGLDGFCSYGERKEADGNE